MFKFRRCVVLLSGFLAACSLTACHSGVNTGDSPVSQSADVVEKSRATIGLTYIPNVQFAPVYVAKERGYYQERGVDVTIRHHGSDEGLFTALIAGEEDVVIASGDEMMVARDSGMELVSIGAFYHSYPATVIVPEDSPIRTMSDLRGRTIGIPGEFGSNWYATLAALTQGGLTTEEVTIRSIGYTQTSALAGKQVDAVVGFTNNDLVQMTLSGLSVRSIPLDDESTGLVSASIITTQQWLDEHPDDAKNIVDATVAGTQHILDEPESALDATLAWDETLHGESQRESARSILQATLPLWKNSDGVASGIQDVLVWERMAQFLHTIPNLLTDQPNTEAAVTNTYATR